MKTIRTPKTARVTKPDFESVNLIFIHGVNDQATGYSQALYENILRHYQRLLREQGRTPAEAEQASRRFYQKEVFWANRTSDLTRRFLTLQYRLGRRKGKWNFLLQGIDPLMIQILYYIKDKGDKKTGSMGILRAVHREFRRSWTTPRGKNVVIAHSLGSVIAFDYLFGFRKYRLPARQSVEAFVTFGSPLPLFTTAMGYVESPVQLPRNVRRWINILDPDDSVARYCRPHFKRLSVEDIEMNCGWTPIGAHTGYWRSQPMAELLAKRLLAWGL
ncbi:MAG: hypothetical protein AB1439_06870 [candidate division FCPU426 bacterium]